MPGRTEAASIAQVKDAGLAVPVPQESQEICFIPAGEDAYRAFLERRWQAEGLSLPGSGPVLLEETDSDGRPVLRPLARHEGLWRYTEGQRRGLGIAHSKPLYVLRKQGEDNTLVVGGRARLGMHGCLTGPANLLCPPEQWPDTLLARLRHRQRPTPARVEITDDGLRITLAEPAIPQRPRTGGRHLRRAGPRAGRCAGAGTVLARMTGREGEKSLRCCRCPKPSYRQRARRCGLPSAAQA